jgi:hypothetical protein
MKMKWSSVQAQHVSQACDVLLKSTRLNPKPHSLVLIHKDQRLPAKAVLRMAYCLANDISPEAKLKFASSESSPHLLRSLGFQAERLPKSQSPPPE